MKAKDLRIGNLVYYRVQDELDDRKEWDEINVVDAEDILYIEACELNGWKHGYSPIPLTDDILSSLGAEKKDGMTYLSPRYRICRFENDKPFYRLDKNLLLGSDGQWIPIANTIEYAHEIQNLHHALKGSELEYNRKNTRR